MNKLIYRLMSASILLGLIFGGYTNTRASSALAVTNTYYVSLSGNDANPGTQTQPWRTIQKAANTVTAGSLVNVLDGTYAERVVISRAGIDGSPITFQAQGTVVMRGFTVSANYITIRGFEITDTADDAIAGWGVYVRASNCVVENNYIHYATRGGVLLFAPTTSMDSTANCIVRNNRLYRNAMVGIDARGRNHLVENNEVWGTIQYHPLWINPPSYVDADGIKFFGSGHVFRGNYIHDISLTDPLNINPHIDAFQTWDEVGQVGSNCIFERNRIVMDEGATGFQLAGANNLTIKNNIVKVVPGINLYKMTGTPYTAPFNITILNNTFIGNYSSHTGVSIRDASNVVVKNNILTDQRNQAVYVLNSTVDVDYNLTYNSNGTTPTGTRGPHDLWNVNPLLSTDYHLNTGSPAIDAGFNVLVINDYENNSRPLGVGYDIGAFEFAGIASPTQTPVKTPTSTNTSAPPSVTPSLIPTITASATSSLAPTATPSVTPTASALPKSPTPTASAMSASPTPTASSLPNTPTPVSTVTLTPTATSLPISEPIIGVFRSTNGTFFLKNTNASINYGRSGDYPLLGDWDGNGTATIGVYRDGTFLLRNSNTNGSADISFAFGVPGDQPIVGDWNGDGIDTVGVYRSSTITFLLRDSNTAGIADSTFQLGLQGDVGITGDWNGDGIDTTGVFRPSNGVIFLKNTNATGFADVALNYGLPGDKPVTGDWNSDGVDTIGVYRNGTFMLRNSNTIGFADITFAFGIDGDMPIAGN